MLLKGPARHVQHMHKALTQMNIQLANVISDVAGETGQKILRAIVAGERDGHVLAAMKNVRIRASAKPHRRSPARRLRRSIASGVTGGRG